MTLWHPAVLSELPLAPVWRALGQRNIGVDHRMKPDGWYFTAEQLVRGEGCYYKSTLIETIGVNDLDPIIDALPVLPGVAVRLALITVILGM